MTVIGAEEKRDDRSAGSRSHHGRGAEGCRQPERQRRPLLMASYRYLADCFEGSRQQLQTRFAEAIDATQLMNSNPN